MHHAKLNLASFRKYASKYESVSCLCPAIIKLPALPGFPFVVLWHTRPSYRQDFARTFPVAFVFAGGSERRGEGEQVRPSDFLRFSSTLYRRANALRYKLRNRGSKTPAKMNHE